MAYPEFNESLEAPTLKEKMEPFIEMAKKIGLKKIGAVLLLLLVVTWFLLQPKAGSLEVSVVEKDSLKPLSASQVDLLDESGQKIGKSVLSDQGGFASFSNVPSTKNLDLRIDAGPSYKFSSSSVVLSSGEKKSTLVEVPRNWDIDLTLSSSDLVLGKGCSRNLAVTVKNNGESADVELVGDGVLKGLVTSAPLKIPKGLSSSVIARFTSPGDSSLDGDGSIRVKKSDSAASLHVKTVTPSELDVSPNSILLEVPPGKELRQLITLTNSGDEESIIDAVVAVGGDIEPFSEVALADSSPIKPGEKNLATLVSKIPNEALGKLVGWVTVTTPCKTYRAEVEYDVRKEAQ